MSSLLALKSALVTRFTVDGAIGGGGATVTWGMPDAPFRQMPGIWVWLGGTRSDNPGSGAPGFAPGQSTAALGRPRHREERYVLECIVSILKGALETQSSVTTLAFTYADAIEANVLSWFDTTPSSYDGVVRTCLVTSMYHREGVNEGMGNSNGRWCDVFIDLAVTNRLNL